MGYRDAPFPVCQMKVMPPRCVSDRVGVSLQRRVHLHLARGQARRCLETRARCARSLLDRQLLALLDRQIPRWQTAAVEIDETLKRRLRRTVLLVAVLNFAYFFVEVTVALSIGSVSLFADSVDFLEDTAVNLLIFLALGWSLANRARMGKLMAGIILIPALAAAWQAVSKFANPETPDPLALVVTAGGAIVVNLTCSLLLARIRHHGGSMSTAAFLAARNDVVVNVAIIAMGLLTLWLQSGWPDIVLGVIIIVVNVTAAKEVWEAAHEESLGARAIAQDGV